MGLFNRFKKTKDAEDELLEGASADVSQDTSETEEAATQEGTETGEKTASVEEAEMNQNVEEEEVADVNAAESSDVTGDTEVQKNLKLSVSSVFMIDDVFPDMTKDGEDATLVSGYIVKGTLKPGDGLFMADENGKPEMTCVIDGIERLGRDAVAEITYVKDGGNENAYGLWFKKSHTATFKKGEYLYQLEANEAEKNPDRLSDVRRKELTAALVHNEIDGGYLATLEIQDICFLLNLIRMQHAETAVENYETKDELMTKALCEKLLSAETLYFNEDLQTNSPFINQGACDVFSKYSYAADAEAFFKKQFRQLTTVEVKAGESTLPGGMDLFTYLYIVGIMLVRVDFGQFRVTLEITKITPPPTKEQLDAYECPIVNPELRFTMNSALSEQRWPVRYDKHEDNIHRSEQMMLDALTRAKLLLPVKVDGEVVVDDSNIVHIQKNAQIQVPHIQDGSSRQYIPFFTDWSEFRKVYPSDDWKGLLISSKEALSMDMNTGVVINPLGENCVFGSENRDEMIKALFPETGNEGRTMEPVQG